MKEGKRSKDLLNYLLYGLVRFVYFGLRIMPVSAVYLLALFLGKLAYLVFTGRRETVSRNIEITSSFLGLQKKDRKQLVRDVFSRSSVNLLVGLQFSALSPKKVESFIHVEGMEILKEAAKKNKGVVIVMGHMGPWEALAHLPEFFRHKGLNKPLAAMYRPLNNRPLNQWMKRKRELSGTKMFCREDGFHPPLAHLREGGILGILADQKMKQGPVVPFFGKSVHTNPLPALFQKRTRATLVGLSLSTIGKMRWKLKFHLLDSSHPANYGSREEMALACNQILEKTMSENLADVFWFQRRFT